MPFILEETRRTVIKLGTGILTSGVGTLDESRMRRVCEQVAELRERGISVLLVSSGAVGLGMGKLGLRRRPTDLPTLQACAAIGQTILMQTWQKNFAPHGITVAQVLLTHEDVRVRSRHVAVRETLERILSLGAIPIINENDTVSAREIQFGDNDILSALVASLCRAEMLVILSTIPGLLDRANGDRLIPVVEEITPAIEALAGGTISPTAVGGMRSKLAAAKVATRSGCGVFIGSGDDPELLLHLFGGRAHGTFFVPARMPMVARKRWIAFFEKPHGTIQIDEGAVRALREDGRSLLAKGVTGCTGSFAEGEVVNVAGPDEMVVARGVARFNSETLPRVHGKTSAEIQRAFPERKHGAVIHRDTLVLLTR